MSTRHATPSETAGSHLLVHVPTVGPDEEARAIVHAMEAHSFPSADLVCVIDRSRRLLGTLSLAQLVAAPPRTKASALLRRDFVAVHVGDDQEHVAHLALRAGASSVVVVDDAERLVGVIPPQALLRVLYHEHEEDVLLLAGVARDAEMASIALCEPPRSRARHRLPWLLVGLAGSAVATWVASRFESTLASMTAVSFFIPAIVYLADAVGTQTEAIVVRGLAHAEQRVSPWRLLRGEIGTGILIGAVLASLVFPSVWLVFGDPRLALAVALSILSASTLAAGIGLGLPWFLHRRGIDPAYGSGPLATVLQDVLSLVLYLLIATALLGSG